MRDLACFRLLLERRWDDPELPGLLDSLALRTARQRVPFFGPLLDLLRDESAPATALHARGLACLGDGDGHVLVERVVAALARPDAREAAVTALRKIATRQPSRYVHALFHPDEAVRSLAIAERPPGDAATFEVFTLADPAMRAVVLARSCACADEAIGAVLDFLALGVVDADLARTLLASRDTVEWLEGARRRGRSSFAALGRWMATPSSFDPAALDLERDDLDPLLDLFWEDEAGTFFATIGAKATLTTRVVLSLLAVARRRGWSPRALTLLFALEPSVIGWTFLPEATRRSAVERTLALANPLRRTAPAHVQPLLFHAMCLHPDGGADLRVLAALMTVATGGEPAKQIGLWLGDDAVVAAIVARPAASAAFFQLLDKDDAYKTEIYGKLPEAAREAMLAAFVRTAPEQTFTFLGHVDGGALTTALAELVNRQLPETRARRLAEVVVQRLDAARLNELFSRWHPRLPASEDAEAVQLGYALVFAAARMLETERFVAAMTHTTRTLPVILGVIDESTTFPYGKEVALAEALRASPDPYVRRWAHARVRTTETPKAHAVPPTDEALARALVTCKRAELAALVEPFVRGGRSGLAAALSHRTDNATTDASVCAALLASNDPVALVDEQLRRYGDEGDVFLRAIELALVAKHDAGTAKLSLLGHAVLWRFERHGKAFLAAALETWGDLAGVVRGALALRWPTARRVVLQALGDSIAVTGARDKARAAELVGPAVVAALAEALATDAAPWAADALLAAFRYARELLADVEPRLRALLVDTDEKTRDKLAGWIDVVGLPARAPVAPRPVESDADTIARLRACVDAAEIALFCADPRAAIVQEATLRLLELGEIGRAELARMLEAAGDDANVGPIAESLGLWDDGPALERARAVASSAGRPGSIRFVVAIALLERGERAFERAVVEALLEPFERGWFRPEHWARLTERLGMDGTDLAIAVAASPQPHAYLAAVQHLLAHGSGEPCNAALRAFLEQGTQRMGTLRRAAAEHLHARGDFTAFPITVTENLDVTRGTSTLLAGAPPALVRAATLSFLAAGNALAKEESLLFHLRTTAVDLRARDDAYETIMVHCTSDPIRQRVAFILSGGFSRLQKLMRVAETFAWGARMGQELLGRLYRVHMTGGKSLGHTFLQERKISVTPLPILRGDRHGREIVEALILHEYGHHLYHRGPGASEVWTRSQREGLHNLLNLVADEHLERNLRAIDASFGDRLKRLAAYAFQHTEREIAVRALLGHLGGHAFGVLTKTHLGVAREPGRVVVDSGEVLFAMERDAMAFPRFVRALRMGLGNRHDDPLVAQGLALFDGDFRHKTMEELWEITCKLREIFGWQVELAKSVGPHETLEDQPRSEDIIWGDGITQDEVDRLVERVLDPKSREGPPPPEGSALKPVLNIAPRNDFDRITNVERVPFDKAQHGDYARKVARPASLMRRYFEELGLHHVQQHARLRGSRFDKSRVLPLVLRGDPRVLIQRELETRTDLFIGIVIDCSGSMASRDNMERARQFGMLLAEACAGLSGVDLRVFGFTDKVIYDCGDAARCAAYALRASGGNNDAAALFHAANVAKRSRRRAKLLVMISDGLPTECTVAALRELVTTLGRSYRMVCAQVAVQPLAEICFPHYVVCNDPTIEQTVARFGRIIMGLVRKTLGAT